MKALLPLILLALTLPSFAAKKYSYYRVGNPNDVTTSTSPGTVLMGGGTDVDAAFQWMCGLSGNGDFLVIRATGTDAYNPYIQQLCPNENSVATLIIPNASAAADPFVIATVQAAEALWIAGGDQSDYINFWKGTALNDAISALIARGAPIGGTSAGMNVLTQFIYSALGSQGVTSSQALADPFNKYITLDRDFVTLGFVQGLIGDPHFVTRDRMGRDLAFLCRIYLNGWSSAPRDISIDEKTALLIDSQGNGSVVGSSTVYFLQTPGAPQTCQSGVPLTYLNIGVYRIDATGSFNLTHWSGKSGTAYAVSANAGVLSSTQPGGSIY
ncbi:MAG TPA: cyanophycinase [Terriglobales bacterium]|nr:cyanophycinase [Terriglobales bacterium]